MSDNIPFEIQAEIIKRVPGQSLLRFRTVSKQWKSLIDSPEFITCRHNFNETQPHHLLVRYNCTDSEYKHVLIVDDNSFHQHKFYPNVPPTLKLIYNPLMLGCSHGLVCSYGHVRNEDGTVGKDSMIVVWNPSIRKCLALMVLETLYGVGFGVCPKTADPKVIKITADCLTRKLKAKIFTLSNGMWRTILMNKCLRSGLESISYSPIQVVVNGVIHWAPCSRCIVTFDLTREEFGEVDLPDGLSKHVDLFIYKPKESLALFDKNEEALVYDVWITINNGDSKSSFEKLCTFSYDSSIYYSLKGCRMNGQLIMIQGYVVDDVDYDVVAAIRESLKVYDPSSKQMNDLEEIDDLAVYDKNFRIASYTESLLMLDQPPAILH